MAQKNAIFFQHPVTGEVQVVELGYSWLVARWGYLVPALRRDWKLAGVMIAIGSCCFGLSNLLFAFRYNRLHARRLLALGFEPRAVHQGRIEDVLARCGLDRPGPLDNLLHAALARLPGYARWGRAIGLMSPWHPAQAASLPATALPRDDGWHDTLPFDLDADAGDAPAAAHANAPAFQPRFGT